MERPPHLAELLNCLQCGYCDPVCPTLSRVGWASRSPRGILYGLKRVAFPTFLDRMSKKRLPAIDEKWVRRLYQCTGCGHCAAVCHVDIDLPTVWEDVRAWLVRNGQPLLPEHQAMAGAIAAHHNPYSASSLARAEWAPRTRFPQSAYTVFFVGCTSSYELLNLARQTVKVLEKAKTDITLLGADEWCCGHPLLLTGQEEEFMRAARHNIEAVEKRGAGRLVTGCPGCYRAFKYSYPRLGLRPSFEVVHLSELLAELLDQGRLRPAAGAGRAGPQNGRCIYHDPCLLGRLGGVYEAPRKVLESLPGAGKVLEFDRNRAAAACCGGGGALRAIDEAMCIDLASEKVEEAAELGASVIVSACPACRINIGDAALRARAGKKGHWPVARDLVELVSRSL